MKRLAGTTGLEPATSDVTGRRLFLALSGSAFVLSLLREARAALFGAATVGATVVSESAKIFRGIWKTVCQAHGGRSESHISRGATNTTREFVFQPRSLR